MAYERILQGFERSGFFGCVFAILSTVTFGWTVYRNLRDRAKIKLTAKALAAAAAPENNSYFEYPAIRPKLYQSILKILRGPKSP